MNNKSLRSYTAALLSALLLLGSYTVSAQPKANSPGKSLQKWQGIHLLDFNNDADLEALALELPKLAAQGINFIILEVDYHFEFKSHPELRQDAKQIQRPVHGNLPPKAAATASV